MSEHDTALHFQDALEIGRQIRQGRLSARQAATYFLDRIERGSALKAFTVVTAERALAQADAADRLLAAGLALGPLHGVPVAVKDSVQWEGTEATLGSQARAGQISTQTAAALRLLAAQGMVVLGKTRMTEFAFGLSGQNVTQGTARNPWDAALARAPGGSSSGSGVAVAAGLAPIALGGDTGGSVRAPATLNGLVGYKPSSGLISRAGVLPLSDTLDVLGPIARSVSDARALATALAGPDIDDKATLALPPSCVAGLRRPALPVAGPLAVLAPEAWPALLDADTIALWERTLTRLAQSGIALETWTPPQSLSFARMAQDNSVVLGYEAYRYYGELARDAAQPLWSVVRDRIAAGGRISPAEYEAVLRRRQADMMAFSQAIHGFGALLMPASDQAAQALDPQDLRHAGLGQLLRPANFLGAAAISLPGGFDEQGMPGGVQLMAPAGGDAILLDWAASLEPVLAGPARRPDLAAWGL
ncbi:amidase [Bordetella avium]|uniref:Amidase n=1 Tax=Bordetella avium (strain 197N) TaxID=360910 RepID=Q2L0T7_BORA1|nr:amidase [Bordetella avium]AZY52533.1 amidase [Bordetella avium]RIQ48584.1 amidase [Bordetella avium]RIQ71341.1 amidase [Bordetella avium]CAJ49431.1 putative amidase [Bordetella avium 197N]